MANTRVKSPFQVESRDTGNGTIGYRVTGPGISEYWTTKTKGEADVVQLNSAYIAGLNAAKTAAPMLLACCRETLSLLDGLGDAEVRSGKRNAAVTIRVHERKLTEAIAIVEGA